MDKNIRAYNPMPYLKNGRQEVKQSQGVALLPCINPFALTQTADKGDGTMRDKHEECGAARMAWELFEKTGSIGYYMLYYDLLRKR